MSVSVCIVFHATQDAHHTSSFCSVFLGLLSVFLYVLRVCVLQCVAECCSVLQCVAACCSVLQCVAVRCSLFLGLLSVFLHVLRVCVLQCVAMCCSVLQCVAACCSVLQCVAVVFLDSLVSFCRCQRMLTTTSMLLHTGRCQHLFFLGMLTASVFLVFVFVSVLFWHLRGNVLRVCCSVCCSVLQRVAACCSVLQCVAMCCSALQCLFPAPACQCPSPCL